MTNAWDDLPHAADIDIIIAIIPRIPAARIDTWNAAWTAAWYAEKAGDGLEADAREKAWYDAWTSVANAGRLDIWGSAWEVAQRVSREAEWYTAPRVMRKYGQWTGRYATSFVIKYAILSYIVEDLPGMASIARIFRKRWLDLTDGLEDARDDA